MIRTVIELSVAAIVVSLLYSQAHAADDRGRAHPCNYTNYTTFEVDQEKDGGWITLIFDVESQKPPDGTGTEAGSKRIKGDVQVVGMPYLAGAFRGAVSKDNVDLAVTWHNSGTGVYKWQTDANGNINGETHPAPPLAGGAANLKGRCP
jgi:hypothetical protein